MDRCVGAAAELPGSERKNLSVRALARSATVSDLAVQHGVSRKFVYQQTHIAQVALENAFMVTIQDNTVLFELTVTRTWLRQIIVGLPLICHSSYRGIVAFLRDLLGVAINVGTVHDVLQSATQQAGIINQEQDLAGICVGLHYEIFHGRKPVLAGAYSTYCYLLAAEPHYDADAWGVHLLDAAKRGLSPGYTIVGAGQGLPAGLQGNRLNGCGIPARAEIRFIRASFLEVSMSDPASPYFLAHFSALQDPRQAMKVLYSLAEILLLMLCATIAGAADFVEIGLWGGERQDFLRRFLPYEHGILSHDTLCDVIAAIDPDAFKTCFLDWVEGLRAYSADVIAIDGKTSRRSHDRRKGRLPLHTISAWATRQRLVLGQESVVEKSKEIAQAIIDGGADYVMALKHDWPATYGEVEKSSPIRRQSWQWNGSRPSMATMAGSKPAAMPSATASNVCSPTAAIQANSSSLAWPLSA